MDVMHIWFAGWVVAWVVFWAGAAGIAHKVPRSTLEPENEKQLVAQLLTASFRSLFVGLGAWFASDNSHQLLEQCGYCFFSYEIVDLIIGSWYHLHTKDMLVHHAVHIVAGGMIWSLGLHSLARPLMTQEMSSIFLNAFAYARNRYPSISNGLFGCFALFFSIFRLGGGSMAAYQFFLAKTHPTLSYFVVAGAGMQWYWGYMIAQKVSRQFGGEGKVGKPKGE